MPLPNGHDKRVGRYLFPIDLTCDIRQNEKEMYPIRCIPFLYYIYVCRLRNQLFGTGYGLIDIAADILGTHHRIKV